MKKCNSQNGLLSLLEKEQFDLIFMDMNLTIMNAIDATKELRNKNVKTPIIALTTNVLEGDEVRFLSYGMDGYLSMPIEASKLNSLLDYYIQLKEKNE